MTELIICPLCASERTLGLLGRAAEGSHDDDVHEPYKPKLCEKSGLSQVQSTTHSIFWERSPIVVDAEAHDPRRSRTGSAQLLVLAALAFPAQRGRADQAPGWGGSQFSALHISALNGAEAGAIVINVTAQNRAAGHCARGGSWRPPSQFSTFMVQAHDLAGVRVVQTVAAHI